MTSVDVVIPSVRLQDGPLAAILNMRRPAGVALRFIVVADNPAIDLPPVLKARCNDPALTVIRNVSTLGAPESRNMGVGASTAEWILFLDDDVLPEPGLLEVYAKAISDDGARRPGFFGTTRYPVAKTAFEHGVLASEILTFFGIAAWYAEMPWATTSNVIVRGRDMRSHRFSHVFPKAGGGEDIDVFLRLTGQAGAKFAAVPAAVVHHDFWPGNRRNYRRFYRWAFGDSKLHALHPAHVYRSAPNAVELAALLLPVAAAAAAALAEPLLTLVPMVGIMAGEWLGETTRLLVKGVRRDLHRGHETALIRMANDLGRFVSLVVREKQWRRFGERFDHFCDGRHVAHQQAWALFKFVLAVTTSALLWVWCVSWQAQA
ncbi:MAG: glycosyltransferase [Planctomycetes bacterium]|nr:glycosyltransferase [Planctomycetota bacterium]